MAEALHAVQMRNELQAHTACVSISENLRPFGFIGHKTKQEKNK